MMNKILKLEWSDDSWTEYIYWQQEDRKTLKKVNTLIKDIKRNGPMDGIAKPDPLRYMKGYSRRIDDKNRLVYDVVDSSLWIVACKGHYED